MSTEVAAAEAAGGLLGPLRGRNFRLLWTSGAASMLADQLSLVAFAWLALQLTGSPLTVGGVLTAAAIPRAALMLLGGTVTDRIGGQRLSLLTALGRIAVMGLLAALVLARLVQLWEVYVLSLGFGVADAFYNPARGSLLPRTVAPEQLEAANSLSGVTQALTGLLGPALGGVLVARAGTGYALAADAVCFTLVAVMTAAMSFEPLPAEPGEGTTTIIGDVVAGLRYVLEDPLLRTLFLVGAAMNFAASGPVEVGLAALARQRLGGATGLGVMLGAFGAGSLLGVLLAGVRPSPHVMPRLGMAALIVGVLVPLIGIAPNLPVVLVLNVVMGAAAGAVSVAISAWVMRRTEPRMMGRTVAVLSLMSFGIVPFSLAAAGAVAQVSVPLLFAGAGALLVLAALASFANRSLRSI